MDINSFPNEVLCRVFDFLVWSDRKRVSLVCRRWNGIINSDRYLRQAKLILYNYSKVQFFSGVEVGLLNTQRNIEFHSSAMLDTDELLMTVAEAFPSGDAVAECVDLFLRSDHEQLFSSVILSLPNLHQLKSLSILANEGFKTFTNGLEIKNENVQKLKLTFYQNTNCRLITPKLTTLNLVIRYPSDINLLNSISHQLKDLTVNFQSKDLVAKLFFCNFEKLARLHLSIANDKYLPYMVTPSAVSNWNDIKQFTESIKTLKVLEIVDKCNMLRHTYLKVFVYAESLTHLTVNYIILDSTILEFISNFKQLQYLNLVGCSTVGEPVLLDLPNLRELLMPYKHYSTLPCINLSHLTTLSYSSSQKNHAQFVQQITKTFTNLKTLNLLNFDYELSPTCFQFLDQLKHLTSLTISDMSVSNQLFTNCPTLPTLQKLKLWTVVTEISLLEHLSNKLPNLYKLNIDNCFFYIVSDSTSQLTFNELRKKLSRCRISTLDTTVFTNEQYDQNPIYIPG
uniref:Putative a receptor for ubiquitination targets n=1 Tax=Culex tarsalis TaxID=7177 RepID=A0A1Q3F8Q8_CULTA